MSRGSPIDDLSRLTSLLITNSDDPPEQVGTTIECPIVQGPDLLLTTSEQLSKHPEQHLPKLSESELSTRTLEVRNQCDNLFETNYEIQAEKLEVPVAQGISIRYQLPPRSIRGIPLKRYDPEHEDHKSRYRIKHPDHNNFSLSAKAFNTSLYSNKVPHTVEQDLKDKHWMKAMEEEIKVLQKK